MKRFHSALSNLLNAVVFLERRPFRLASGAVVHPSEVHMLDAIEEFSGANVQRLASELGITKGAASQMLKRLEAKGLLSKEPGGENSRDVVAVLTARGRRLHAELHEHRRLFGDAVLRELNQLGAAERDLIAGFLERMAEHLRLLQTEPEVAPPAGARRPRRARRLGRPVT